MEMTMSDTTSLLSVLLAAGLVDEDKLSSVREHYSEDNEVGLSAALLGDHILTEEELAIAISIQRGLRSQNTSDNMRARTTLVKVRARRDNKLHQQNAVVSQKLIRQTKRVSDTFPTIEDYIKK
jgi:hypothetical protein